MPVFATPGPITATLELVMGETRITAGDRTDTVVDVRPANPDRTGDVKAAEQTRVDFQDGRLVIKTNKLRGMFSFKGGAVDITIELPTGSSVRGDTALGSVYAQGTFGDFRFRSATGDISLDRAGSTHLHTAMGNVNLIHATGHTDVLTGSGQLHVERVDGTAVVRNSNGNIRVGTVTGDLRAQNANGDIAVTLALADVTAKTANGSVRLDEVVRGTVVLETGAGRLEVGIRAGTAAWLDVRSALGAVQNDLEAASAPDSAVDTAEVRARTGVGDIVIRRATPTEEDDS
ncbi:DUF4097 and DUF4098 domain-containing protein YvlB [Saccharothrix tamanrassetensis]|uniref:DUF4097 and DUF4098 domain-containing protein YvlB n=1 Tax=Saccharothrix tamanrassetensis TaxID=1051531 RepID=A0A841CPV5_9PSEU|nr:DUF4097 family beta strand repeat-containing protein [Saccharothrix tamanrassetensis]MBB5959240.1 DUF4097 and DUF4098 domain-containing protein YvlB [Saccharothrix tamanrassetensis]